MQKNHFLSDIFCPMLPLKKTLVVLKFIFLLSINIMSIWIMLLFQSSGMFGVISYFDVGVPYLYKPLSLVVGSGEA